MLQHLLIIRGHIPCLVMSLWQGRSIAEQLVVKVVVLFPFSNAAAVTHPKVGNSNLGSTAKIRDYFSKAFKS